MFDNYYCDVSCVTLAFLSPSFCVLICSVSCSQKALEQGKYSTTNATVKKTLGSLFRKRTIVGFGVADSSTYYVFSGLMCYIMVLFK